MASVQARHSRLCAREGAWTPAREVGKANECTCRPMFYVVFRDGAGKLIRERSGPNRQQAERLRDKRSVELFEGNYQPVQTVAFREWGPRWLSMLERKASTVASYESTVAYATGVFGDHPVSQLGPDSIAGFNRVLRERGLSDSTRAKHLRVLGACLASAVEHGLARENPVKRLPRSEKPRPARKEAAYFENDELPPLFAVIEEGLYRTIFLAALKTGIRQGELLALTWADIDLQEKTIHVRRSFTGGELTTPKNHLQRSVHLTGEVVEHLDWWRAECASPPSQTLVFPGERKDGGCLAASSLLRRHLYPAMQRAGIPRAGPTGQPRTFHSFRHTFAQTSPRNRPPDHLALQTPRPLNPQRHNRRLPPLGTRRTQTPSRTNDRPLRRLTPTPTTSPNPLPENRPNRPNNPPRRPAHPADSDAPTASQGLLVLPTGVSRAPVRGQCTSSSPAGPCGPGLAAPVPARSSPGPAARRGNGHPEECFNGKLRDEQPRPRDLLHPPGSPGSDRRLAPHLQPAPPPQLPRVPPIGT